MARYKPYSYEQGQMIPIQFEKQILPESFEYAINYIVEHVLDTNAFVQRIKNDETGAPAYDPKILLKIIFYAYARGIIHSREIASNCEENVMFMALSANTRPHFTTIANFITTMSDGIEPMFMKLLMWCDELGLIGKEMFAIDGCKISSNASKEWSGTKEDFKNKAEKYQTLVSRLIKKHQEEDARGEIPEHREKEKRAIEKMEEKIKKITQWNETHEDKLGKQGQAKKSHMVDNDSGKMPSSHGVLQGYNAIAAVDKKTQVIVVAKAYGDQGEQEAFKPMVEEIENNFKKMGEENIFKEAKLTVDSGFHSEANVKMLDEKNIDGYVPDHGFRKRDPRFDSAVRHKNPIDKGNEKGRKYYGPDDFKLDEQSGKLMCPWGKMLYVKNRNFKTPQGLYGTAYMAKVTDCRVCPLRKQCLVNPNTKARQVYKFEGWDETMRVKKTFSEKMREKMDQPLSRFLYSMRMGIVEPVFANIRHMMGLDRFTLRGKIKVDAQWKLYAMVHNMGKVYRYQGAG